MVISNRIAVCRPARSLTIQYSLEVLKKKMNDTYVWIDQDDRAEVMTLEQILQAADNGRKPKHIFLTKSELILRYQLVPKSRQDTKEDEETVNNAEGGRYPEGGRRGAGRAAQAWSQDRVITPDNLL